MDEVDWSGRIETVSLDIVIVVIIPSGSTVVMTEAGGAEAEDVVSVTGYNVSVVDDPSGPTVVMVMASSVLMGKLVMDDVSVEVGKTLSVGDCVVVTVVVSEVVLTRVVVSEVVLTLTTVVVVGLK